MTFLIPVTISNPLSFIKLLYRDILNWLNVLMQAIQEVRLYKREELSASVLLFFLLLSLESANYYHSFTDIFNNYLASMETSVPFFCTKFWRSIFMRIEQMKNVDIRTVDPESLVSVNFLTYTTCI